MRALPALVVLGLATTFAACGHHKDGGGGGDDKKADQPVNTETEKPQGEDQKKAEGEQKQQEQTKAPAAAAPVGPTSQYAGPRQAIQPVTFKVTAADGAKISYALEGDNCAMYKIDAASGVVSGTTGGQPAQNVDCSAKVVADVDGAKVEAGTLVTKVPGQFKGWCEAFYNKQGLTLAQRTTVSAMLLDVYSRYMKGNFIFLSGDVSDCGKFQSTIDGRTGDSLALTLCDKNDTKCHNYWNWDDGYHKLSDLGPVATLRELNLLDVRGNDVKDLAPLEGLSKLMWVLAPHNQIESLAPLAGLGKLVEVDVASNAVTDVAPLAGLEDLLTLDISANPVVDLSPLKDSAVFIFRAKDLPFKTQNLPRTEQNCPTEGRSLGVTEYCSKAL